MWRVRSSSLALFSRRCRRNGTRQRREGGHQPGWLGKGARGARFEQIVTDAETVRDPPVRSKQTGGVLFYSLSHAKHAWPGLQLEPPAENAPLMLSEYARRSNRTRRFHVIQSERRVAEAHPRESDQRKEHRGERERKNKKSGKRGRGSGSKYEREVAAEGAGRRVFYYMPD